MTDQQAQALLDVLTHHQKALERMVALLVRLVELEEERRRASKPS